MAALKGFKEFFCTCRISEFNPGDLKESFQVSSIESDVSRFSDSASVLIIYNKILLDIPQ